MQISILLTYTHTLEKLVSGTSLGHRSCCLPVWEGPGSGWLRRCHQVDQPWRGDPSSVPLPWNLMKTRYDQKDEKQREKDWLVVQTKWQQQPTCGLGLRFGLGVEGSDVADATIKVGGALRLYHPEPGQVPPLELQQLLPVARQLPPLQPWRIILVCSDRLISSSGTVS